MDNKTLLIISAGIEAIPGILRAKKMGLFVVVLDGDFKAPGIKFADDFINASTYDIFDCTNKSYEYSTTKRKIDGVISMASDVPLTVSSIAQKLSITGNSIETAQLSSNKLKMKDKFKKDGVKIPWYKEITNINEIIDALKLFPKGIVIKPIDNRGSRGVLFIDNESNIEIAYEECKKNALSGTIIAEEYLEGIQISTESIIFKEFSSTPGFVDRNYELFEKTKPNFIENGGSQPSVLNNIQKNEVEQLVYKAAKSMGIVCGTIKGDIVYSKNGPVVIEMAARLSGGWFATDQIPIATGVDIVEVAIKISLGIEITYAEIIPKFQKAYSIRYFLQTEYGKIKNIEYDKDLFNKDYVYKYMFFVDKNDTIGKLTDHTMRPGFVITSGVNREQSITNAENICNSIKFHLE